MGILNVTPDSFSDGGRFFARDKLAVDRAIDAAAAMVAEGADILDIGGESTRPGARAVSETEELDRVVPAIAAIRERFDVALSVDTSTPAVMTEAVAHGAGLINDVRALARPGALEAARDSGADICLMHMRGEPGTMAQLTQYEDLVPDVIAELQQRIDAAISIGIKRNRLWVDPGFGFAKTAEQNVTLLARLEAFRCFGLPILVGLSRKRLLEALTGRPVEQRLAGSLALALLAAERGADVIRVHDVAETRDVLRVLAAVRSDGIMTDP